MRKRLFKSVYLPHPPEVVWEALTDRHALAEWLMPNDFEPALGHEFTFHNDPEVGCGAGVTHCRVLEFEPQRRLTLSWRIEPGRRGRERPPMRIAFELIPQGEGTRLTLEQTGLEGQPFITRFLMNIGWGYMLKRLLPRVAANVRPDGDGVRFEPGAIPLKRRTYKVETVPETHTY